MRSTYEKVRARLSRLTSLGYSASGVVTEVGREAGEFHVGDRVACAGAGYASHAEVIYVPKNLCCKVPGDVPLESACYTTVGAIALQGLRQADPRLGETVAVIGLGLVGQLTVQLLKAGGCQVLGVDIDQSACELAKRSGADQVAGDYASARTACDALTGGRGADCVVITAATKSSEPLDLAAQLARDRARVVVVGLVGMDLPRQSFYEKELELRLSRSYGPGRYDQEYEEKGSDYPIGYVRWTEKRNMEAFVRLIGEGKVNTDLLTSHRFTVERAADAYDLMVNGGERYCGIVLEYPNVELRPAAVKPVRTKTVAGDELGVSFIGAGNFARGVLLPIVKRAPKVQLLGVGAATGLSAKSAVGQFGFSYATTDYREILEDEASQVVFVATRHDSHAQIAAEALRRGKHVFVEKPLSITDEGLREVIAAAQDSNGLLMVGYNRRFAQIAREIKSCFRDRSGPMTVLYRTNAGQFPRGHWAHDAYEGGGRIVGEVCHFIDFIQYLTGALPARVNAEQVSRTSGTNLIDDSTVASISMSDGSIATIVYAATGDISLAKERVEIFCDGCVGTIDDFKRGTFVRNGKTKKFGGGAQDKGHAAEIQAFLEAVRSAGVPITLESLAATTLTSFAIGESARSATAVTVDLGSIFR